MLAVASFNLLAALPAILGFTGFVIYLVMRSRRPPSPVVMEILKLLRQRSGRLPELDQRLSGKAVHNLLAKNEELRKAIPEDELRLLDDIRKDEQRENLLVFSFLGFALTVSLVLYVVLEWKPWTKETLRPISELIYNVRLVSPVIADSQPGFTLLKQQCTALLSQAQGQKDPKKWLADQGLLYEGLPGTSAGQIENYNVTLLPGGSFAARLVKAEDPTVAEMFRSFLLAITVVENTEAAVQAALTNPKAPNKWQDLLMASIDSPYTPLTLTLDFHRNSLVFGLNNVKPFQPRVTQSVKYWNDFKNHAIVILPAMLAKSELERFEIWSAVGPELPDKSQRLEKRIRIVDGESQEYFVYR